MDHRSMIFRFKDKQRQQKGIREAHKRPSNAATVNEAAVAEKWRNDVILEMDKNLEKIHDPGYSDSQIRDLNDALNNQIKEKGVWEQRIFDLGGPDYISRGKYYGMGGLTVPGTKGYRYFGRATDLPGVKELFEQAVQMQQKITPEELKYRADCDYFGLRDEDDGKLVEYEMEQQRITNLALLEGKDIDLETLSLDFIVTPEPLDLKETELWIVKNRKEQLIEKYLNYGTLS